MSAREIDNQIAYRSIPPPERCCYNCAFCNAGFRTYDYICRFRTAIARVCGKDFDCSMHETCEEPLKTVCNMFFSKDGASTLFSNAKFLSQLEMCEAAGMFDNETIPVLYRKILKNTFASKHDATNKQIMYAKAIADRLYLKGNGSLFKDNDFNECPPLVFGEKMNRIGETWNIDISMSDDKMQLRDYIGRHDAWFRSQSNPKHKLWTPNSYDRYEFADDDWNELPYFNA